MKRFAAVMLAAMFTVVAHAEDKMDWKACGKEVKEFKCKGSDKQVWACLKKQTDKLSKECQEVQAMGDEKFKGKGKGK